MIVLSSVTREEAVSVDEYEKKLFFAPSLANIQNSTSPIVQLYGLTKDKYKDMYKSVQGVTVTEFENLLSNSTSSSSHLLDLTKVNAPPSIDTSNFHGYTAVFAGTGSPSFGTTNDDTVQSFDVPHTNINIQCKFGKANEFQDHVPLSVGLIDSALHGIAILPSYIKIINKAVGNCGLFTKRSKSLHNNSLSFIGKRSDNHCAQPTPSEGPKETGYWYYRQRLCHFYWPFVLHLMMYLGSRISLLSYYQYTHLSKLLPPLSNNRRLQHEFSEIAI